MEKQGGMQDLNGKIILVTGAGRGTGRNVALALAAHGALLAVNDLTPINLDETVARIQAAGGQVKAYLADIAKKLPVQGLLNQVLDDLGRIDILINCAEVDPCRELAEMDEWDWARTLDVNLTGAFLLTQSAARIMRSQGGGLILLLDARLQASQAHGAYRTSKAGLAALATQADSELSAWGVRVHLLQPEEQADWAAVVLALSAP